MNEIISKIETTLRKEWKDEPTGHDWEHIRRVRDMAMFIQKTEGGNPEIIELGALLHDISDHKFNGGKLNAGGQVAYQWLLELGVEIKLAEEIKLLVDNIYFKGAKVSQDNMTLETQIVQDADRLDAIGAIGIARAFAFGGNRNQLIYSERLAPTLHSTFEEYVSAETTTINHFYEKLLLLAGKINTATGKKLAVERHDFMESFLNQFYSEWNLNR